MEKTNKNFGFGLYSNFHILIRIISFILIVSFLVQDIAWAYPDKLAPESFFNVKESSRQKAYALYIKTLVEKTGKTLGISFENLNLDALALVLSKNNIK